MTEKTYGNYDTREALIEAFAEHVVEGMDMDTLVGYAIERLIAAYGQEDESHLIEQIEHFAPHLLEE